MGDNLTIQRKSINHLPELKKKSLHSWDVLCTPFFSIPKDAPKHFKKKQFYILCSLSFWYSYIDLCVVFIIPSKYSIYLGWKYLEPYSIYSFELFDFCIFQYFSRPVSKFAKNDFDRDENRTKFNNFTHILIFFLLILKMSDILLIPGRLYIYAIPHPHQATGGGREA